MRLNDGMPVSDIALAEKGRVVSGDTVAHCGKRRYPDMEDGFAGVLFPGG